MTPELARREAAIFETLMLEPLFAPLAQSTGALGGAGSGYLAESLAERDRAFGDVLARILEHRNG